jgi:predicted DNA-binding protein (MmcQ/YjbR family)
MTGDSNLDFVDPHGRLLEFALGFPGAWEDHPWEEIVVKVGKKIFVFVGSSENPGVTVKLPDSNQQALLLECCTPTGYGLGKAGWVSVDLRGADVPPLEVVEDWIEESYRTIATKKLIAELDAMDR